MDDEVPGTGRKEEEGVCALSVRSSTGRGDEDSEAFDEEGDKDDV